MSVHQDSLVGVCLNSSFFEGLATRDIRSVVAAATPRRFLANSILYNQGEPSRAAYLLIEGRARYFYVTPEGQKIVFTSIMPGELMGAAALVRSISSHNVSAEVLSHSRTLAWDKSTIRSLTARYPRLLDNGLSIMAAYITWLISAHVGLACDSAQLRLAQIITNLASRSSGTAGSPRGGIELAVTNEELAHAASVTPFTVSRLMSRWQRSGFLTKSRGKVLLRSPEGLLRSDA
jgi:CRP/FNR family transcriptional regulator, nitrogen oxide reductase regulator